MRTGAAGPPRPRLLLVDDDPQILQLLNEIGGREGFEVVEAADGALALEMMHRRHMDLVLLDLHMPRVNGIDVLRAVRAGGASTQIANGGTVFLDEAGELPPGAQAKLLRTLENGELQRVGSVELKKVDVRVIAATNRRLDAEIAAGRFRSDLYYRLNVVEIAVPPLRERSEDIPYLTAAFVRRFAREFSKSITGLTEGAEERLVQWPWPGNVRELRNVIERACLLCEGHLLTEGDLARSLSERPEAPAPIEDEPSGPPPTAEAVQAALDGTGGNKSLAARRLGISRRALYRLIDKYAAGTGA